jgi:hypothetical protein
MTISSATASIPTTPAQATAFQQSKTAGDVSTTVGAKVESVARQQGAQALQLLSSSTVPSTPSTSSHGGSLDTTA